MTELKTGGAQGYLRIATEEAFAPPEMMRLYRDMLANGDETIRASRACWGFYLGSKIASAPTAIFDRLQDLGARRIADMDERGIDRQVIALTAPGTQIFGKDQAVAHGASSPTTSSPKPAAAIPTATPA